MNTDRQCTFLKWIGVAAISSFIPGTSLAQFSGGFGKSFLVRSGGLDIYLEHKPPLAFVSVGGVLAPIPLERRATAGFALRGQGGGVYTVDDVTAGEQAQMRSWPEIAAEAVQGDFNADGYIDLLLAGVESAIVGSLDQIIFAPKASTSLPLAATAIDATVDSFAMEFDRWLEDPAYFLSNATVQTSTTLVIQACGWSNYTQYFGTNVFGESNSGIQSYLDNYCVVQITYPSGLDFGSFDQDALAVSRALGKALVEGEFPESGSPEAEEIEQILKQVLGVEVLDGVLGDGGVMDSEVENEIPTGDREGTRVARVIAAMGQIGMTRRQRQAEQTCQERAWGTSPITQQVHYNRNSNQSNTWTTTADIPTQDFRNLGVAAVHNFDTSGNEDWRGLLDGPYEGWQIVTAPNGTIVTSPENIGTFDFRPPPEGGITELGGHMFGGHLQFDITPWLEWGNLPQDSTTRERRLEALNSMGYGLAAFWFHAFYNCLYN